MGRLRGWASRLRGVFGGARREQDLADELESHLQLHIDDNVRQGMTPDAARTAALIRLGGLQSVTEQYRDQRSIPLLSRLRQDVRYAGRTLRRSPGFAAVALTTIALGVAGPTITFTMTKAWILEPLPFADPDALVDIRSIDRSSGDRSRSMPPISATFSEGRSAFSDLAGYRQRRRAPDRRRSSRARPRRTRHHGVLQRLGNDGGARPGLRACRRRTVGAKARGHQRHAVARSLSRRPGRDWPHAASGRPGLHRHWSAARRLSLHAARARSTSGGRSCSRPNRLPTGGRAPSSPWAGCATRRSVEEGRGQLVRSPNSSRRRIRTRMPAAAFASSRWPTRSGFTTISASSSR